MSNKNEEVEVLVEDNPLVDEATLEADFPMHDLEDQNEETHEDELEEELLVEEEEVPYKVEPIYIEPRMSLLNSMDSRSEAWRISRPYLDHAALENDIEKISKMDLPIGGFTQHVIYLKTSLFFRDLLLTLRPIVPWARSQRTIPFVEENMFLSSESKSHHEFNVEALTKTFNLLKEGVPQDTAKTYLPMSFMTEYTISIDERTLINFLSTLRVHSPKLYEVYGKTMIEAIGKTEDLLDRKMVDIYDNYALSDEELLKSKEGFYGEMLDTVVLASTMTFSLFSQFIRQHYSRVTSEIWNIMNSDYNSLSCRDEISVVLYTSHQQFQKVVSNRLCFFAQFDSSDKSSWNHILAPVVKEDNSEEFTQRLPCKGCAKDCTIVGDMIPRMKLIEVNPPCPILIGEDLTVKLRKEKYNPTSVIFEKWSEIKEFKVDKTTEEYLNLYKDHLKGNDMKDAEGFDVTPFLEESTKEAPQG